MTTRYFLKNSILGPDATLTELGRECLAFSIAKKYDLDFTEVWNTIKDMNSVERDEYLDQLK